MNQTKKIEDMVLAQFRQVRKAVIDASSIIYVNKAGFLQALAQIVELYTPEEVFQETGFSDLPIHSVLYQTTALSNDDKLLSLAESRRLPVVSEDKKILSEAKHRGLPYFNAIMMLHFLLYKGEISQDQHTILYHKLTEFAWYGTSVLGFAHTIHKKILDEVSR